MLIKKTIKIDCNREQLWVWLTDFEKIKAWNKDILEEELAPVDEVTEGFKSRILIKEGKQKNWYNNEILTFQKGVHLSTSLTGGNLGKSPMVVDYHIKELENGIELSYQSSWKPIGFFLNFLYPVIRVMANKNADSCLRNLKSDIENS